MSPIRRVLSLMCFALSFPLAGCEPPPPTGRVEVPERAPAGARQAARDGQTDRDTAGAAGAARDDRVDTAGGSMP